MTQAQEDIFRRHYKDAFGEINKMLNNKDTVNFCKAVFLTENAYCDNKMNITDFDEYIEICSLMCDEIAKSENIVYTEKDKERAMAQCAAFVFMTDSVVMVTDEGVKIRPPFSYNSEDFAGQKEWSNTFVSTLMQTQKGNCHSLPYLYKIIMNELGYESHLALAPNHIYIKANNKKVGWYNIELTCGDFPTDAWLMASGYIHTNAIRNGTYMRALSEKESVAMTLVDLAQGYQAKFGIEDGSFMLMCCNTALKHFPNYINALLLKGEILTELYRKSEDPELMSQMTERYTHIHELGYRKMPDEMYMKWLDTLKDNTDSRMKSVIVKK
ncbi:hypothetical protein [uncultured Dysgonomonas sp.]|nr:hypothetical protein [uncultured Dysgonomonas sp.]